MINKAADQAVAKYHDAHVKAHDTHTYHQDMDQGLDNRYNTVKKEGKYFNVKRVVVTNKEVYI